MLGLIKIWHHTDHVSQTIVVVRCDLEYANSV